MSKHGKSLLNDAFIRQAKLAKERQHYRDQRGPRISLKIAARDKKAAERPIVMSVQWAATLRSDRCFEALARRRAASATLATMAGLSQSSLLTASYW